jgi:CheY-like chemotaxis protein
MGSKGLTVKSVPNEGSCFAFELPLISDRHSFSDMKVVESQLDEIQNVMPRKRTSKYDGEERSKSPVQKWMVPKVWVVDDNPFNLKALKTMLTLYKVEVEQFVSSSKALAAFKALTDEEMRVITIVFLDLQMPTLDGFELHGEMAQVIAERPPGIDISFVACSGEAATSVKEQAIREGFFSYIVKPVLDENLSEILDCHGIARK